ncbi:porin [Chitinimonas taiwanensis]|uniref:Outer membrane protein (Porin) n=1 Tax=Chitinimonas taiwanensis DSM 18899 TaxID=1121279 RepID=A0A1K2HMJ2_9NEIS|nr:porin [Chitinimonas taiwanensis]SFZ78028.1 Outer membrane protein (porin) [Chitinimonas taiwanensis DSM 18899]
MNKKFIALAVAAAVAPAAFAGDEVILYGQVNVAAVVDNTKDSLFKIDGQSSRIGVKGTESLGNGMSAWFQIESKVAPDDASASGFATREGWVGLKGDFGGVQLGRGKSAFTKAYEEFDLWYQADSFAPFDYGLQTYNDSGLVPVMVDADGNRNDAGYQYRTDNTVRYTYAAEGLDVTVDYAVGENKNDSTKTKEATNLSYSVKGTLGDYWYIVGANMGRNLRMNGSKLNNLLLGGGTTFGDLAVGAGFTRSVFSEAGYGTGKRNSYILNASYALEGNSLYGGVIVGDKLKHNIGKLEDSRFVRYGAGLAVPLSKRTNIVTEYMATNFSGATKDTSYFSVGAYHSF